MSRIFLLAAFSILLLSASDCKHKTAENTSYKGKLSIAGICSNYTITVLDGKIDTALLVSKWTDENTGKQYTNAFRLGNPCDFPSTIKEGDEFFFVIDSSAKKDCMVCMAYYPTPPRSLKIRVVEK